MILLAMQAPETLLTVLVIFHAPFNRLIPGHCQHWFSINAYCDMDFVAKRVQHDQMQLAAAGAERRESAVN